LIGIEIVVGCSDWAEVRSRRFQCRWHCALFAGIHGWLKAMAGPIGQVWQLS
jgi:hypothetical protein